MAGDQAAFAAAYDQYAGRVYGLALRILSDPSSAEEVTQDVFVAAWTHRAEFEPERGTLTSWLLAVARNRAIDRTRGVRGRERREVEIPLHARATSDVEATALNQAEQRTVSAAVAALPAPQRHAIEQAYFVGRSARDIAERAGVPLSTVKGRMRLGLQRLAQDLDLHSAAGPLAQGG